MVGVPRPNPCGVVRDCRWPGLMSPYDAGVDGDANDDVEGNGG